MVVKISKRLVDLQKQIGITSMLQENEGRRFTYPAGASIHHAHVAYTLSLH